MEISVLGVNYYSVMNQDDQIIPAIAGNIADGNRSWFTGAFSPTFFVTGIILSSRLFEDLEFGGVNETGFGVKRKNLKMVAGLLAKDDIGTTVTVDIADSQGAETAIFDIRFETGDLAKGVGSLGHRNPDELVVAAKEKADGCLATETTGKYFFCGY